MSDLSSAWQQTLNRYERLMERLLVTPGLSGRSIGVPEWDAALQRTGREWIAASPLNWSSARPAPASPVRDVYLATQLYEAGGHTALVGDFVRALDGGNGSNDSGNRSHVILTGLFGQSPFPLQPTIQRRVGVPAEHVTLLPGPTLLDRASQLFALLHELRPQRLFLFQHPHDVLASVCAQPEVAAQTVLVHHSDGYPTFGLHLPHVQIIDLSPSAAALTRLLGARSCQLALTSPDPGARPHRFLRRGALVTASCGSAHKFFRDYLPGYPEIIASVLHTTQGWHVHVGELYPSQREQVDRALEAAGCPLDRFEYVPFSPSLARTLWDHSCDLLLASFPISGARTRVEALAAGLPYVRHSVTPPGPEDHRCGDAGVWHRQADLIACLTALGSEERLAAAAAAGRAEYERIHHPAVFGKTLTTILGGGCEPDPEADGRRLITLESMARTTIAALLPRHREPSPPDSRLATLTEQIEQLQRQGEIVGENAGHLRQQQTSLSEQMQDLAARVQELGAQVEVLRRAQAESRQEYDRRLVGASWRHHLRRWLLKD